MRGRNRLWTVALAVVLLAVSGCTENDLDESEADVVLEVLGINNPEVQGDTGAGMCSGDNTILCLDNQPCEDNMAGFCDFPDAACTITEWSADVQNSPLTEGGTISPFNDIVITAVTLSYTNLAGAPILTPRVVPVSATIVANSTAGINFAPIAFNDLTMDNVTINVGIAFVAQTVAGQTVDTFGASGAQLFIEDCLP